MPTDTEHPTPDQLAAFDSGTLPDAVRERVERHVAGCASCCRLLEQLPEDTFAARVRTLASPLTNGPTAGVPPELLDHPRIEILGPIGSGGMGAVYRAVQRHLGRPVAVKVLHHRLTQRPGFAERFRQEVQALARLNHPHIVQAHDADRAGESHFLVMELVDGESLDALVRRRGPLPPSEACELIRQAALGLQHAHEHGLVHRDIKPGNLLLAPGGVVKIADFGLARLVGGTEHAAPGSAPTIVGTPEYIAPEQARDPAGADIRADLYSLGCTLYFLLAGRPPFTGASPLPILLDHQDTAPRPIPGLPPTIAAVLDRLLAKDPRARFATPAEVARALADTTASGFPTSSPAVKRRWWPVAVVAGVIAGATAAVFALSPRDRPAAPSPDAPTPPEIALAPPPRPVDRTALATPEQLAAWRREAAGRLVDWVRANNRWRPDAPIVTGTAVQVDEALPTANGFNLGLGGGLVRSGKPTLVAARTGGFFVFELTPEQARGLDLVPNKQMFTSYDYPTDPRRARPRVRLADFRIDSADDHPPTGRLEGSVACEFVDPPQPGDYLRITHHATTGGRVMFLHHPPTPPPAGRTVIRFSANPLEPRTGKGDRLVVVFAEWVSKAGVVESDMAAALALVRR
jgi:hypothetical protein